jgi:hypothetical protein
MGQYYLAVFLHEDGEICAWIDPTAYSNGAKLLEHSYRHNRFMNVVEHELARRCRLVWAGDYAEEEKNGETLHERAYKMLEKQLVPSESCDDYKYIVNHTKKLFVNMKVILDGDLHPLSLLVCEGNGKGGGDYYGINYEDCGTWARDVISMQNEVELDYKEFVPHFSLEWS